MFRRFVTNQTTHAKRAKVIAAGAAVTAVALAAGIALVLSSRGPASTGSVAAPSGPANTGASPAPTGQATGIPKLTAGVTVLATVRSSAARYASPGRRAAGMVPTSWYQRPSVLPVIATKPGWVHVRLAQRPNGSTAWLPASDVTLSSTPYRIVINVRTLHLSLFKQGKLVFSTPAGVGVPDDPTPLGKYFVAFDEQPPGPGYGAFVMVTSAHSPAISDWEGSGDAVIGIHGPLGMDAAIGTTGAMISHGCVRLHEQALEKLSNVPPGTPIDVIR